MTTNDELRDIYAERSNENEQLANCMVKELQTKHINKWANILNSGLYAFDISVWNISLGSTFKLI